MSTSVKYYIALLIAGISNFSYAIEKIVLMQSAEYSFHEPMVYAAPFEQETLGNLELGESLSEAKVIISGSDGENYRLELQLETSMSVSAEGPHLDLTNWKHCTTGWRSIKAITGNEFQLPDFNAISTDCFPKVSHDEIKAEVLKQGGEYWVSVLEKEGQGSPNDYNPVGISLSTVRIKIEKLVGTEWEMVTVINVAVQMGC